MIFRFDAEIDVVAQNEEEANRILSIICDTLEQSQRIKGTAYKYPYEVNDYEDEDIEENDEDEDPETNYLEEFDKYGNRNYYYE